METVEYGPRGLLGVMTPQANTTVEPEFQLMWPPGYAMINARLTSPKKTIEERLVDYYDALEGELAQFANAPIRAVAVACTGASYLVGKAKEEELVARWEAKAGVPVITAGRAVADAFRRLGAKRIGLASPYPPGLTEISVGYWQDMGFEVGAVGGTFNTDPAFHPIYSLTAESADECLLALDTKDIDAIVMLGTGMPTLEPIARAAKRSGPPVLSCMLALAWATLEAADGGSADPLGRLKGFIAGDGWAERLAQTKAGAAAGRP